MRETSHLLTRIKLYYFGELIYYACVGLTKIAILLLYLRLIVQSTYRRVIWGVLIFVVASVLACLLASIFQCTPIHKAWDTTGLVQGHCINVNTLFFANAGLDIFQDAIIYVLPMKMLWNLQVPNRQKFALMLVFAVGGFVVITGMIRLNSLKLAQNTPDPSCKWFLFSSISIATAKDCDRQQFWSRCLVSNRVQRWRHLCFSAFFQAAYRPLLPQTHGPPITIDSTL